MTSVTGSLNDLFQNAAKLTDISKYLKDKLSTGSQQEQGDINSMLEKMGCFHMISKDEAGDNYYRELAKQLYQSCTAIFPTMGGIIPLIDLFYAVNKK